MRLALCGKILWKLLQKHRLVDCDGILWCWQCFWYNAIEKEDTIRRRNCHHFKWHLERIRVFTFKKKNSQVCGRQVKHFFIYNSLSLEIFLEQADYCCWFFVHTLISELFPLWVVIIIKWNGWIFNCGTLNFVV